jgi:hypothetical protein
MQHKYLLPSTWASCAILCWIHNENTQQDDTKENELVQTAAEKILSKAKKNDTCKSAAMRRLIVSSFDHQSNDIVGASMASYLTQNISRFYFSHTFAWFPLRDIGDLLLGEQIHVNVIQAI